MPKNELKNQEMQPRKTKIIKENKKLPASADGPQAISLRPRMKRINAS
jgi:hypothetical protein